MQEVLGRPVQVTGRLDVQAEQPGERQVDLLHLLEIQLVAQPPETVDLLRGQALLGLAPSAAQACRSSSTYGEPSLPRSPLDMCRTLVAT